MTVRISQLDDRESFGFEENENEILEALEDFGDTENTTLAIMLGIGPENYDKVFEHVMNIFRSGQELDENIIGLIEDFKNVNSEISEEEHVLEPPKNSTPNSPQALLDIDMHDDVKDILNKDELKGVNKMSRRMRKIKMASILGLKKTALKAGVDIIMNNNELDLNDTEALEEMSTLGSDELDSASIKRKELLEERQRLMDVEEFKGMGL